MKGESLEGFAPPTFELQARCESDIASGTCLLVDLSGSAPETLVCKTSVFLLDYRPLVLSTVFETVPQDRKSRILDRTRLRERRYDIILTYINLTKICYQKCGWESGIRTHVVIPMVVDLKSTAFDQAGLPPNGGRDRI